MEARVLSPAPLLALTETLRPTSSLACSFLVRRRTGFRSPSYSATTARCFARWEERNWLAMSFATSVLGASYPGPVKAGTRMACMSSAAAGSGSGGGGDDGGLGRSGGSGGGGGGCGGETESKKIGVESDDASALGPDVIVLDVGGMSCGGCADSVKRILEGLPQVSSASVNLATETAVVWVNEEVKMSQNWKQQLGETLANQLTTCGFKSSLRGQGQNVEGKK